jgi:hypothetical protein
MESMFTSVGDWAKNSESMSLLPRHASTRDPVAVNMGPTALSGIRQDTDRQPHGLSVTQSVLHEAGNDAPVRVT